MKNTVKNDNFKVSDDCKCPRCDCDPCTCDLAAVSPLGGTNKADS